MSAGRPEETASSGAAGFRLPRDGRSAEHRHLVETFQRWEGAATPLTLVEGEDGVVTLVDAEAPFRAA